MRSRRKLYDPVKRGLDLVGAGIGVVALAPIMGSVAALVRVKLGSPVLFKQARPGRNGEVFTLYKFRSMLNVDEKRGWVSNRDRMTLFGRKLRATSLDELPSLLNVLKGDMSLVGPRPLLVSYLERYSPEQARRHEVRPGVTGLAQVSGRNDLDWNERFELDTEYVDNRSFSLDLRILGRTMATALRREGIASDGHAVGAPFEPTVSNRSTDVGGRASV